MQPFKAHHVTQTAAAALATPDWESTQQTFRLLWRKGKPCIWGSGGENVQARWRHARGGARPQTQEARLVTVLSIQNAEESEGPEGWTAQGPPALTLSQAWIAAYSHPESICQCSVRGDRHGSAAGVRDQNPGKHGTPKCAHNTVKRRAAQHNASSLTGCGKDSVKSWFRAISASNNKSERLQVMI